MKTRLVSASAESTRSLGEALGRALAGPLAILLSGDYGTGKTTFVQGLARGLDISGPVRSPSYSILKRYAGRLTLVHADFYRTQSAPEIEELGIAEILAEDGVLAVEWPGGQLTALPEAPCLRVAFAFAGAAPSGAATADNLRAIEFDWSADLPPAVQAVLHALAA